ncbi:MAG TPA: WhiB family transcriptional regulator [Acidimicrobiales bacterium]|nr:WhiB family transcriptional regulator [Acidimicrobiales bacterium]
MARARCRDLQPSVFFPNDSVAMEAAQKICLLCPVASDCLEYALANRINHGVWGGASERARRRMAQSRRNAAGRLATASAVVPRP